MKQLNKSNRDDALILRIGDDKKLYILGSVDDEVVNDRLVKGFDHYHEIMDYIQENGYTVFDTNLSC